jgi:hypothetical protein
MALGLFNPQLFIVFPFLLLARRMWRGLVVYVLVAAALAVVSLLLVGPAGLNAWFHSIADFEAGNSAANAWRMASLKSFFDLLLPGMRSLSLALYAACATVLLALVVWLWSLARASLAATWALTCLAAVLIDPHLVDYDLTVLVCAGVLVLAADATLLNRWMVAALYISALLRPELPIGEAGVLITPLVLIVLLCATFARTQPGWRLSRTQRATPQALHRPPIP